MLINKMINNYDHHHGYDVVNAAAVTRLTRLEPPRDIYTKQESSVWLGLMYCFI